MELTYMISKHHFNVIGDIYGRSCWRDLVKDDCINIFVGDYFDPYDDISFEQQMSNFYGILCYQYFHSNTILLYGNHDLHYLTSKDRSSRYDAENAETIRDILKRTEHLFKGVAYGRGGTLITHAGVTKEWYEKEFGPYNGESPRKVARNINNLWCHNKIEFTFDANADSIFDLSGESPTHSPLWVRPWTLAEHNLFAGTRYKQVFGHTQVNDISVIDERLICVDCLGTTVKSYDFFKKNGHIKKM